MKDVMIGILCAAMMRALISVRQKTFYFLKDKSESVYPIVAGLALELIILDVAFSLARFWLGICCSIGLEVVYLLIYVRARGGYWQLRRSDEDLTPEYIISRGMRWLRIGWYFSSIRLFDGIFYLVLAQSIKLR